MAQLARASVLHVARYMLGEAHAGNGTTIRGASVPRMNVDGYNETRGSALQRLTSVLTNARSHNGGRVRDGSSCERSAQTEV